MAPKDMPTKSMHAGARQILLGLLVKARKDAGMTQQQLAKKLHHPQSFVSKIESGERRLNVIEFLEVCRVLGIDPFVLMRKIEARPKRRQR